MEVLLTGASGFVGSLLMPALLRDGHAVRALTRDPTHIATAAREAEGELRVMRGDAVSGAGLPSALSGVEVAFYLIHSMERTGEGGDFAAREQLAAHNFAQAARAAGVRRIVYLGGLVPRWRGRPADAHASRHLASREAVEETLLEAIPGSIALRASIVIGERSRSFRLLVRLVERMPVLTLPAWQRFRTQPIDERDVRAMLISCLSHPSASSQVMEIGGADVLSYGEMLTRIAELLLIARPALRLKVNLTPIAGRVAAAIASEQPELVLPLMEGLQGDLLPREDDAPRRLGVRLHSFDSAVEHALAEWERSEPLAAR